jgi:hypothetical protein
MKKIIIAIVIIILSLVKSQAQNREIINVNDDAIYIWGDAGVGAGTAGLACGASLNLNTNGALYTALLSGRTGVALFSTPESSSGLNLMYGRVYKGKEGFLSASVGLSYLQGVSRGDETSGGSINLG